MPELEEPGWPNLSTPGVPSPGQTFLRAFAAVSEVNRRKQQLEQQLIKMDQQNRFNEMKHELDMDKFERDSYFKQANLQRAYDLMAQREYIQEKGFEFRDHENEIKTARKDQIYEDSGKLSDELAAASQKYPIDSKEWQNEVSLIRTKYNAITNTPEGARAWNRFDNEARAARTSAHQSAADLRRNFKETLTNTGHGDITEGDFLRDDKQWHTNKKGEK